MRCSFDDRTNVGILTDFDEFGGFGDFDGDFDDEAPAVPMRYSRFSLGYNEAIKEAFSTPKRSRN